MYWANFLHLYQPPRQNKEILNKIVKESYEPIINILKKKKIKITLNISGSLTEQLTEHKFLPLLHNLKELGKRGQIEFTDSAKYHVLLPLLPKKEILRQIKLNHEINKRFFKTSYKPQGFFLPEMCYDKKSAHLINGLSYKWIILDEILYQGKMGKMGFEKNYKIKNTNLYVIFRNRVMSDPFFSASIQNEKDFQNFLVKDKRSNNFLITAFDGENLGHHKKGMDKVWEKLLSFSGIETITFSELLKKYKDEEIIEPMEGSWSSNEKELENKIPYLLWNNPRNEIHQKQWQLINLTIKKVNQRNNKQARKQLDQALNSDPFWWASMSPWWSVEIITEGAQKLINILNLLKSTEGNKLFQEIVQLAHRWQKTGKAEKIKSAYLSNEPYQRFFGGKKI